MSPDPTKPVKRKIARINRHLAMIADDRIRQDAMLREGIIERFLWESAHRTYDKVEQDSRNELAQLEDRLAELEVSKTLAATDPD